MTACRICELSGTSYDASGIVSRLLWSVLTCSGRPYWLSCSATNTTSMNNSSDIHSNSIFPAEYPVQYDSTFVNISLNFAAVALVFYEYIITLQDEVAYFWGRKFTGASLLFYSNRYLVLAYSAALLRGTSSFTKHSCAQWSNGVRAMEILSYIPWAALSGLRVYALSGRARGLFLGAPVFILSIVPVCINFADFTWTRFVSDTLWGCSQAVFESSRLSIILTIVSRISLIIADLTVIVTTWIWTYGVIATLGDRRGTVSGVILCDGTCYFIALLLLNVLHLAFCASSVFPSSAGSHISDVVVFIEPITSVLMSRFMLGLQEAFSRTSVYSESDVLANATSLTFEKVVGSLAFTNSSASYASSFYNEEVAEDGDPWRTDDEIVAAPREGSWENPFADVEAAGRASSLTEVSVSTRSSIVFS